MTNASTGHDHIFRNSRRSFLLPCTYDNCKSEKHSITGYVYEEKISKSGRKRLA